MQTVQVPVTREELVITRRRVNTGEVATGEIGTNEEIRVPQVRLIDQRTAELALAPGVPGELTPLPEAEVRRAPPGSAYVILTHDHALDFLIAAEALARGDAAYVGMIGSATKRATFSRFARSRGIAPGPLTCPIGGTVRDKRPEVIAAFTAAEIMATLLASHPAHATA